jgi:DNA gyrase subunit A
MGNYHPHGDASIYDTLVRLAQDFNMRAPLVDGQGNFGSVDGDPPAAMRYTEARLEALGDEMMTDLDKDTVDFVPNYDETTTEPSVLPAPFPNLLVNGSAGIAVGMATNIPPHNMREVIDAVIWMIDSIQADEKPTLPEKQRKLLELVPGPTSLLVVTSSAARHSAGLSDRRGSVIMRAKAEIEVSKKGDRSSIVISAIPYQVNKKRLIEHIAELVNAKTIEGVSDIRDESDRDGLRIVIDLKRGEIGDVVLNNLYKHTQLQTTFGIIMLAIVAGRPKVLSLLELIETFIDFRREVVRRPNGIRAPKGGGAPAHPRGLKIALDHLDAVIRADPRLTESAEARDGLIAQFGLTQIQAQAILDMQLQRLTGLEREKILAELADLLKLIERLMAIPRQRSSRDADRRRRAPRHSTEVQRPTPNRDPRRRRRVPRRGSDRRRRHGDHRQQHRLHQADGDHQLPESAPRRQRAASACARAKRISSVISLSPRRTPTS